MNFHATQQQNHILFFTVINRLSGTIPSEKMQLKELSELVLGKVTNLNYYFWVKYKSL